MAKWSQEAMDARADQLKPLVAQAVQKSNADLAALYKSLKSAKEELEAQVSAINLHQQAIEKVFSERFAEADTTKMEFEDGTVIKCEVASGPQVQDNRAFVQWLKATNQEHELKVHAGSIARICREAKEAGLFQGDYPPGVVESVPFVKFSCK